MRGIKLFEIFGITVRLDWTWFLLLYYEIKMSNNAKRYPSVGWHLAEFLGIFVIVLLHEFGHALACRSVGGLAKDIMLWPLGGVAYVQPPHRPGAMLWSIAAGPLVNVVLAPVLLMSTVLSRHWGHTPELSHLSHLFLSLLYINVAILIFNLLPVYPLDGGQIVQSILWFFIGFARSLRISTYIGLFASVLLAIFALYRRDYFMVLIAGFIGWRCWSGMKLAREILAHEQAQRDGFVDPEQV